MDNQKKAIIVTNGLIRKPNLIKEHIKKLGFGFNDLVISADGGAQNALKLGLNTHMVTGDMDSIEPKIMDRLKSRGAKFIVEKPEKDHTDTHLALKAAVKEGAQKVVIIAAIGDRVDHSLANLLLLADPHLSGTDIRIITETEEIFAAEKPLRVKGKKGDRISLFSLSPYTLFTETKGLKYGLKNEKLVFSPIRGISNEFVQDEAFLGIKQGMLLIIKQIKEDL